MSAKYILRCDKLTNRTITGWEHALLPIGNG